MRRRNIQPIAEVLRECIRENKLDEKLKERELIAAWSTVMGEGISGYTSGLYVKNRVLFVSLRSPALRSELSLYRSKLVDTLNNHVNAPVITDIIFM